MADAGEPGPTPRIEERSCIICGIVSRMSELTKPKDQQSVETLRTAAKVQNFTAILNLSEDENDLKRLVSQKVSFIFQSQEKSGKRIIQKEILPKAQKLDNL